MTTPHSTFPARLALAMLALLQLLTLLLFSGHVG